MSIRKFDGEVSQLWFQAVRDSDCRIVVSLARAYPNILLRVCFTNNIRSVKMLKALFQACHFRSPHSRNRGFVCTQSIWESVYGLDNVPDFITLPCLDLAHRHTDLDQCILYGDIYRIQQCAAVSDMACPEWSNPLIRSFVYESFEERIIKWLSTNMVEVTIVIVMDYFHNPDKSRLKTLMTLTEQQQVCRIL